MKVALIAAASALAGTLVGGGVTYLSNERLENRQVAQEEARQTTASRAVARVLMVEYETEIDWLEQTVEEKAYIVSTYHERIFVSKVGLDDRKLLAGHLSEGDWAAVSKAEYYVEAVEGALQAHHGAGGFSSEEREVLERATTACNEAKQDLTPLADGSSS